MRRLGLFVASAALLYVFQLGGSVNAGEAPNLASLPVGFKYCPAPGADNKEFNSSYYAVDARTGEMTRYVDGVPRQEPFGPVDTEEKILYVAPPISVENRYVPYPGAAPQEPPPEFRQNRQGQERNLHASAPVRPTRNQPGRQAPEPRGKQPWWKKIVP